MAQSMKQIVLLWVELVLAIMLAIIQPGHCGFPAEGHPLLNGGCFCELEDGSTDIFVVLNKAHDGVNYNRQVTLGETNGRSGGVQCFTPASPPPADADVCPQENDCQCEYEDYVEFYKQLHWKQTKTRCCQWVRYGDDASSCDAFPSEISKECKCQDDCACKDFDGPPCLPLDLVIGFM